MVQEVQVKMTIQIDASLSKEEIKGVLEIALTNRGFNLDVTSIDEIKEESEIYETEK